MIAWLALWGGLVAASVDFRVGFARCHLAAMRWHIENNSELNASEMYRLLLIVHMNLQERLPEGVTVEDVMLRAACPRMSKDESPNCTKMKFFFRNEQLPTIYDDSKVSNMYLALLSLDPTTHAGNTGQLLQLIKRELGITIAPWLAVRVIQQYS
jgi:hypothetical protein